LLPGLKKCGEARRLFAVPQQAGLTGG